MGDKDTQGCSTHGVSRRTVLKSSGAAVSFAGLAGTVNAQDGESLRLGYMMPLTGKWGFLGQAVEPSIRMMVQTVNERGGIGDRQVELFVEDTKGNPSSGLTAARKHLESNDVDMMVGPSSFSIMQVVDLVQEAGIPWMVPCSGTSDLIPIHDTCGPYRTISNDAIEGWVAAINARFERFNGVKDFERVGVFTCKTADCKSLSGVHTEAVKQLGANHAGTIELPSGQASYDTQVRKMRSMNPEIVYIMAGPPVVKKVLRTSIQIGFDPYWNLPSDFSQQQFLSDVPEQVMDRFFTYIDTAPSGVNEEVLNRYQEQYREVAGSEPGPCWNAAVDAMNVLLTSSKAASVDGDLSHENICSNIRDVSSPPGERAYTYEQAAQLLDDGNEVDLFGLLSNLDFTENGEVNVPFNILVPNDDGSEYQRIGTITPENMDKAKQGEL